jgi:hypothetical protein
MPAVPPPASSPVVEPPAGVTPAVEPAVPEPAYYQRLTHGEPADAAVPPGTPAGANAHSAAASPTSEAMPAVRAGEPPMEDVEVTDLLLIVDLKDEVLVVDEHPRYHVPGCSYLPGRETIPVPLDEARADGFTPCGVCSPDRALAQRERLRK